MECIVDGKGFDPAEIIYRDQGYGSDPGLSLCPFEVRLSIEEFSARCRDFVQDFVAQCKIDDSNDELDIPELRLAEYPEFDVMLERDVELLKILLVEYLYFDLLAALFLPGIPSRLRFAINKINNIEIESVDIRLFGVGCYA